MPPLKIPISMPVNIIPIRPRKVYRMMYSMPPDSEEGKEEDIADLKLSQKMARKLFPSLWSPKASTSRETMSTEPSTVVTSSFTMPEVPLAILRSSQ